MQSQKHIWCKFRLLLIKVEMRDRFKIFRFEALIV